MVLVLILLFLIGAMQLGRSLVDEPRQADDRHMIVGVQRERVTRLHFYFHDRPTGNKPTSMVVAQAAATAKSPTGFGAIFMADDPLTEGPELTSKLVGRAQGLYGSADQNVFSLVMAMNFVFTGDRFNGSTICILGRNPTKQTVRELPIAGGTGVFRLARGFAVLKTYFFNATTRIAIVEYNVTVFHY